MFDLAELSDVAPLQQSAEFARALAAVGHAPLRLDCGALVMRRRFGPLTLRMIARAAAPARVALRGLPGRGPVILSPEHPRDLGAMGAVPLVSPSSVAEIDLARPVEELLAGQDQKWRNRLRHAQAQSLRIARTSLPDEPRHWLLVAAEAQARARRYRIWPADLTLAYARETPGAAQLFTAISGRTPVAAILVLRHGAGATYHIGHADAEGRRTSAHNLLLWDAMLWLRERGVRLFDLGTVDTESEAGLARFKLGSGARARALGGTWLWWPPATTLLRPVAMLDQRLMRLG